MEKFQLTSKDASNFTTVACDGNPRALIVGKHIIEDDPSADVHPIIRLPLVTLPELILFGEPLLKFPFRVVLMNISLATTSVAGMHSHCFSEELFDRGIKWSIRWQGQGIESQLAGLQASDQWRDVVRFRSWRMLRGQVVGPELVGLNGFISALRSELCISPAGNA